MNKNSIKKYYVKINNNFKEFYTVNGIHAKKIAERNCLNSKIGDVVSEDKYYLYTLNKN